MKKLLFAMAIGAALAWLFDPDAGSRRRDLIRRKLDERGLTGSSSPAPTLPTVVADVPDAARLDGPLSGAPMNTPTLPQVSLPHVGVHDLTDRAGDVGELVSGAFSSGLDKAQDLAAVAYEVIEDIPDKALALASAVIPALRPAPRRSRRPLLLLVAVLASVVVVAWFVKRRRATSAEAYAVPGIPTKDSVSAAS